MRAGAGRRRHPAVHGVAVGRRHGPLVHPVHAAGLAERPAEGGEQPAPARGDRDQLPRGPVVRHGRDDDAPGGRDAADRERAVDEHLRLSAVQRHPQQLDRTAPLHPDEHGAVGQDGRRRLVPAVVQFRVQQRLERTAGEVDAAGHGLAGGEVQPVGTEVGDGGDDQRPAVGGVGRHRAVPPRARDPPEAGAVGADDVHVPDQVAVGALVTGRDEGQLGAVRAPGHVLAVGVAGRDLQRLGQRGGVVLEVLGQVEHEHLAAAVGQEPDVVQPVLQGRDQPGRLGPGTDPLDGAVAALLGHPRGVGEPARVRGPDRRPGAEAVLGQPAGESRRRWAAGGAAACRRSRRRGRPASGRRVRRPGRCRAHRR